MQATLLLVDSSPAVQRLVEQASKPEGLEVVTVKDGLSALTAAERMKPDVIVADYRLDGITLIAFCERLAGLDLLPHTAVIALVNASDQFDEGELRFLGVKALLQKPFEPDDLVQTIKHVRQAPARVRPEQQKVASGTLPPVHDTTERPGSRLPHSPENRLASEAEQQDTSRQDARAAGQATTKPGLDTEQVVRRLFADVLEPITQQTERTVAQLLPDLVSREIGASLEQVVRPELLGLIEAAQLPDQAAKTAEEAVQRELPDLVAKHLTTVEPAMQRSLNDLTTRLVEEITDRLVKDLLEAALQRLLPDIVRAQLGPIDKLVKDAVEEATAQYVCQTADLVVKEVAREAVQEIATGLAEQVVREIVPDVAEAAIKKEIDRLTASD